MELSHSTPLRPHLGCLPTSLLECRENSPYCIPRIAQLLLNDSNYRISIMFNEATNEPPINTLEDLFSMIHMVRPFDITSTRSQQQDPPIMSMDSATWADPMTLDISFPAPVFNSIYEEVLKGMMFQTSHRSCEANVYSGSFDMRLNEEGNYTLAFAYQSGDNKSSRWRLGGAFASPIIKVSRCDSLLVHIHHQHSKVSCSLRQPSTSREDSARVSYMSLYL